MSTPYYYSSSPDLGCHPILFALICALAIAEIGLLAYMVDKNNDNDPPFPSNEYENRAIFLLFTASWTALGGVLDFFFSMFMGSIWCFTTWIFWLVGAILLHEKNDIADLNCDGTAFDSICRMRVAVEAIAWTEMGLCVLLFFTGLFWVHSSREQYGGYNNAFWRGYYSRY